MSYLLEGTIVSSFLHMDALQEMMILMRNHNFLRQYNKNKQTQSKYTSVMPFRKQKLFFSTRAGDKSIEPDTLLLCYENLSCLVAT